MIEMILLKNREEWLQHRMKYIGGSDSAAVLGMNPYRTNVELFRIKTGQLQPEDISEKPHVKYGTEAEKHIRELFKLNYPKYEVLYEENNSFINDKYPFAAASLDGWLIEKETGRHGIWECKTSEIVSSMHKEKWNNRIPDNYFCQLLHYFMVREDCEFAHLTALLTWKFSEKEIYQQLRNYHIERSEVQEDIEYLEKAERRFWQQVQTDCEPALILPGL
jgi:putative phage-type endonuclease